MARGRKTNFSESAWKNNTAYIHYYNRLSELAISMFEWTGLPETIDARFLELSLFTDGMSVFFRDEVIGFLALKTMIGGELNVYNIPTRRNAFAANGYHKELNEKDSVIVYNNLLHTNSLMEMEMFAKRLYDLDQTIDVNARSQKTPILIACDETQRLTMKNIYMQYDGNSPVIFADKAVNPNAIRVFQTGAPYVADKLYSLKTEIWNEALTYLGISNINTQKKERMITDEVSRNQGGVVASRYSRLTARQMACEQINKMFDLDIWCNYREDFQIMDFSIDSFGEENKEGSESKE